MLTSQSFDTHSHNYATEKVKSVIYWFFANHSLPNPWGCYQAKSQKPWRKQTVPRCHTSLWLMWAETVCDQGCGGKVWELLITLLFLHRSLQSSRRGAQIKSGQSWQWASSTDCNWFSTLDCWWMTRRLRLHIAGIHQPHPVARNSALFSDSNVNSALKYRNDGSKSVEWLRIKCSNDPDFPLASWSQSWTRTTTRCQQ